MTDEEFERELTVLLNSVSEANRKRLEALQWKCDQIRRLYGNNHLGATIELSRLMMDSMVDLVSVIETGQKAQKDGKVIDFNLTDKET